MANINARLVVKIQVNDDLPPGDYTFTLGVDAHQHTVYDLTMTGEELSTLRSIVKMAEEYSRSLSSGGFDTQTLRLRNIIAHEGEW